MPEESQETVPISASAQFGLSGTAARDDQAPGVEGFTGNRMNKKSVFLSFGIVNRVVQRKDRAGCLHGVSKYRYDGCGLERKGINPSFAFFGKQQSVTAEKGGYIFFSAFPQDVSCERRISEIARLAAVHQVAATVA